MFDVQEQEKQLAESEAAVKGKDQELQKALKDAKAGFDELLHML